MKSLFQIDEERLESPSRDIDNAKLKDDLEQFNMNYRMSPEA